MITSIKDLTEIGRAPILSLAAARLRAGSVPSERQFCTRKTHCPYGHRHSSQQVQAADLSSFTIIPSHSINFHPFSMIMEKAHLPALNAPAELVIDKNVRLLYE